MDIKMLEKLKLDLKEAVDKKDTTKIEEISRILNISEEQKKYFDNGLTGYPTIDKPWLKHYKPGAEERAVNIPANKTIWDAIEKKMEEDYDVPALEYFGKQFSREEFSDLCYTWARTFRAIGVEENEVVPIYGPFLPDIAAMLFGLNMIGASPYFLKLAMDPKSLAEETEEAKIAVVFNDMWPLVAHEFSKDKYKNIVVATATANMPSPKKQIVSFLSKVQSMKDKSKIPNDKKYIWVDDARKMAKYYTGEVKVPFAENRNAVITSSSGTTGGVVKGVVATNESILSQVFSTTYSDTAYVKGFRTLNHFPPTASTSLNSLFLVGLMNGATIVMDPRVSINDFYNQLTKLKPNACINTSSIWEAFFNRIVNECEQGKKFDFEFAKAWLVGGEGTTAESFDKWNEIMHNLKSPGIYGGYGLSETFSGVSISRNDAEPAHSKPIATVGVIQAGMNAGIFDNEGKELPYNQRGELMVNAQSRMKGYYKKPHLTEAALAGEWIKTGDVAEIDEDGFLYIWGRDKNAIDLQNGEKVYLFDVENKIRENEFIHDVVVLPKPTEENDNNLVAHIVWNDITSTKEENIETMNEQLKEFLPEDIEVSAYAEHEIMLPYSPTTLKKDKVEMAKQATGFIQVIDGKMNNVEYILNENGKYSQKCAIIEKDKIKSLRK